MLSPIDTSAASPLASARAASAAPSSCASARRPKTSSRSTSPRFSARTPSTTSVASAARCSAALFMWAAHWRSRSGRSAAAINSLIARMPLSGVRISCASMASAVSVAPDRAGRARFLRRPLADFALLALRITHPSPPAECHARADTPISASADVQLWAGGCPRDGGYSSPTMRRISAGVFPCSRSSRSAVARVDLESFLPSASRISRW